MNCSKKLAPHLLDALCKGYIQAKNDSYGKIVTIPELNIEIRYIPQSECFTVYGIENYLGILNPKGTKFKHAPGGTRIGRRILPKIDRSKIKPYKGPQSEFFKKPHHNNCFDVIFSTPEEREKNRRNLQQSKSKVKIAHERYLSALNNLKREIRKFEDKEPKSCVAPYFDLSGGRDLAPTIYPRGEMYNTDAKELIDENINKQKREETMKSNIGIARIAHKKVREYCIDNKIPEQVEWDKLPDSMKANHIQNVLTIQNKKSVKLDDLKKGWIGHSKKITTDMVSLFIKTVKAEMKK